MTLCGSTAVQWLFPALFSPLCHSGQFYVQLTNNTSAAETKHPVLLIPEPAI